MRKPITVSKVRENDYLGLINQGNRNASSIAGNLGFPTPLPPLSVLMTAIAEVSTAYTAWGEPGNRGSQADLDNLREKAAELYQNITSLASYVQNTVQIACGNNYLAMAAMIRTSGFDVKNAPSPQGVLQAVRNFHRALSPTLRENQAKLSWKLPLGVSTRANVHGYSVRMSVTADFASAVEIGEVTVTTFIDTNLTNAPVTRYYWVVPFGAAGFGVESAVVIATLGHA